MSVPFANFSSQDRHKMQGAPAAVHPNPVLSMSLSNVLGETTSLGLGLVLVSSIQEALTHGAVEPAALAVALLKHTWIYFYLFIFFRGKL